jgi:hypothetical protein
MNLTILIPASQQRSDNSVMQWSFPTLAVKTDDWRTGQRLLRQLEPLVCAL